MNLPIPLRWRRAIVGLALLPVASPGIAAEPEPFPVLPGVTLPPDRTPQEVQILYGTRKVYPYYRPQLVLPLPPMPVMPPPGYRLVPEPSVSEESRTVAPTEVHVFVEDRATPPAPIILAGYSGMHSPAMPLSQQAPWLGSSSLVPQLSMLPVPQIPMAPNLATSGPSASQPATAAQPTIVVIRESGGEARPAPLAEAPRGITLGGEALLGIGIGAAGLGFGFAGWRRKSSTAAAKTTLRHPEPTSPMAGDGVMLMGKYNSGPRKETAERFDMGVNYETEKKEKKKTEAQSQQAVLEFILSQNLALHAELGGEGEGAIPEAMELPADHPEDLTTEKSTETD